MRATLFALLIAIGAGLSAQISDPGYSWGRWRIDFNNDGHVDFCRIVGNPGQYRIWCTLSSSGKIEDRYGGKTIDSGVIDIGYAEGRAWVDFDGDGRPDFCRIIGNGYPSSYATCTFSEGYSFGKQLTSDSIDWGYPDSRVWKDVNGDKLVDFCRAVGNYREFFSCTFSLGRRGFGKTIQDLK